MGSNNMAIERSHMVVKQEIDLSSRNCFSLQRYTFFFIYTIFFVLLQSQSNRIMYFIFQPYLRPMIWGGERILPFKQIQSSLQHIGESWEISAYLGMESRVKNGPYQGCTLTELADQLKDKLLGQALYQHFGNEFPLLIKFIDAAAPLSIQVHPSDALAQKQGKGKVGKTEMWYSLASCEGAYLLSGLKTPLTPETYKTHVENHSIVDDLARYEPKKGDCFFLPAGRVHAIGSGCFLLEIQQTSDLTYRIYDYDRRDAQGNTRELHTALAAESIDYTLEDDYQTHYSHQDNAPMPLVKCPYFETTAYCVTKQVNIDWHDQDRFLICIVTEGEGTLAIDGENVTVKTGDTILLPATTNQVTASGQFDFLAVTCPC